MRCGCDGPATHGVRVDLGRSHTETGSGQPYQGGHYPTANLPRHRRPWLRTPIEPSLTSLITLHHAPEWAQPKPKSWRLSVSSIRMPSALPNVSMKTCNKWMQIQVKREALQLGLDDAMILNEKGNLTEVSCANCFVIEENCLITPPSRMVASTGSRDNRRWDLHGSWESM